MSRQAGAKPRRRGAGHARRPRQPLRRRIGGRLPSAARVLALLVFAGLVAGFVTLANGPWLRVARVDAAGERYTLTATLDAVLADQRGASLLTLDASALEARLGALPAVASAEVRLELPDRLTVTIAEKVPAFTWLTPRARLVAAADGAVIGELPRDAELPADLAALPRVDDQRTGSRRLAVGDALRAAELAAARRLLAIEPAAIGSAGDRFDLRIDDEFGFLLVSHGPDWKVALGFYQLDPTETEAEAVARLEAQVGAVRTLFATEPEAEIGWVDARNPGKVYWAR